MFLKNYSYRKRFVYKSGFKFLFSSLTLITLVSFSNATYSVAEPFSGFADIVEPLMPAIVNISTISEGKSRRAIEDVPIFKNSLVTEDSLGSLSSFDLSKPNRHYQSLGSGFIISQKGNNLFVVTCSHVIQDANKIKVIFYDDHEEKAEVIGIDRRTDIAVLRVKSSRLASTVKWGNSKASRPGDWLISIGNPFGLSSTITVGVISSIARDLMTKTRAFNSPLPDYIDGYIQTDASINMGNSGGPMFNIKGEVIGISTVIFSPNGGSVGIGFSIPSDVAKDVVNQLCMYGKIRRGWIGIQVQNVSVQASRALGLSYTKGALVNEVIPFGPASKAGIKNGDVILYFRDIEVKDSRSLLRIVGDTLVSQRVPVIVWRQGHKEKLLVTVNEYRDYNSGPIDKKEILHEKSQISSELVKVLGMDLKCSSFSTSYGYDLPKKPCYVLVTRVHQNSEASRLGIKPGSILLESTINLKTEKIISPSNFLSLIKEKSLDGYNDVLLLLRSQKGTNYFVTLAIKN